MIEDIHEPVDLYRTVFREAHARNTSEFFEDLVRRSGVDERANIVTVKELRVLESQVGDASSSSKWWKVLRTAVIVFGVISLLVTVLGQNPWWLVGVAASVAAVFGKLNPIINDVTSRLRLLKERRDAKEAEAWQQMEPLNRLHDWNDLATLVRQTVPRLALDPYFANARLDELRHSFGWDDSFNRGRSVVFAHSGVLNGNPFVLARTLDHWMGTKTYRGSLNISWTEQVRDANGRWTTTTRHQTLHASVAKPFPEYANRTHIIYGNEAAPDLSFSRSPSKLSGMKEGMIGNWKKGRAIKKLEAKSRDITGGSGFTVMANREFDALFGATDRNHEVQFRLIFTALAQQEMVKLLKDKEVGYGDDFAFEKHGMINMVEPAHMAETDIIAEPEQFHAYELAHARQFYNEYHNDFFKSFFFGLAPLLVIPLYQQHRSHADIYKDDRGRTACFWEHESLAYHFGEARFQHPDCVTRSILKTEASPVVDGVRTLQVTADGYRGIDRTDYVSVYGGDGRYHDVPVHWVEYIEVGQESNMVIWEDPHRPGTEEQPADARAWQSQFESRGVDPNAAVRRRTIISALLPR